MPTPSEMRADAERLREIAAVMDGQAEEAHGLLSGVEQALSGGASGKAGVVAPIWSGQAPEALEERIRAWVDDSSRAADEIEENAHLCRVQAGRLEDDATAEEEEAAARRNADEADSSGPSDAGS